MTDREIARVAHEANRAWCKHIGDKVPPVWEEAGDEHQTSMLDGVVFIGLNPDAPDSHGHDNWLKVKLEDGWTYGPVKDFEAKTHPCIAPFEELPPEQQFKDKLFRAIVHAAIHQEIPRG